MKRRAVLTSVGTVLSASVAGCAFARADPEPTFTLHGVRSFLADPGAAIVVGTVEKEGDAAGEVTIRAELLIEDEYDHVSTQTFVIPEDLSERVVALPFTADSPFYAEQTFTGRAKIIRHDGADGTWVTETEG